MRGATGWGILRASPGLGMMGGGGDPYAAALTANCVSQYKLNEASGNALDSIGGYNLTQNGTSGSTVGKINLCRTFDGSCYFNRTPNAAQSPASKDFSYSVWFYLGTVAAGTRQILSYRNAGSDDANLYFILRMEADALVAYNGLGTANTFDNSTRATGLSVGQWYHYAASYTNSTKTYRDRLNGGTVGTWTSTTSPTNAIASPILAIGGDVLELMGSGGRVDCAKLWINRALSDNDMLLDWNNGNGGEI